MEPVCKDFYFLPTSIAHDQNIGSEEKLTIALLLGHSDPNGICSVSINFLCEMMGVNESKMLKILQNLENNNYINKEKNSTSTYLLNVLKINLQNLENGNGGKQ